MKGFARRLEKALLPMFASSSPAGPIPMRLRKRVRSRRSCTRRFEDLDIVKVLVEGGADVNALAEDLSGDLDEFEFLDEAFQHAELDGLTALVYAVLYGHTKVKEYLAPLTNAELRAQARKIERQARQQGEG